MEIEKYLKMLPKELVNKIMLYNPHPVADLFNKGFEDELFSHFAIDHDINWCADDDSLFAYSYLSSRHIINKFASVNRRCECFDYIDRCICCDRLG
jgi:hypothetical protein